MNKNGLNAKVVFNYDPKTDTGKDLWFVIWNWIEILPKKCIIYNMDPMVPHIEKGLRDLIARSPESKILKLVDYCYGLNLTKLADLIKDKQLETDVLIYGHSVFHQHMLNKLVPERAGIVKDIDILWYGIFRNGEFQFFKQCKT